MKKIMVFVLGFTVFSCAENEKEAKSECAQNQEVIVNDYEFHKMGDEQSPLLILFPDLGGNAQSTKENFNILTGAKSANVSVLLMNFNHHLFLSKADKDFLTEVLNGVIESYDLSPEKIVIGGFSSGGIVGALWSNHLIETNHTCKPQKVFVVDSPLDLVELFNNVTDVNSEAHEISITEAEFITNYFEKALNTEDSLVQKIAEVSPFNYATLDFGNIQRLDEVHFRLYTEPDSIWWKENRGFEFKETDAYQLIRFANTAKGKGWDKLELIQTTNKGINGNGERHPHSWSIVDPGEMMDWVLRD